MEPCKHVGPVSCYIAEVNHAVRSRNIKTIAVSPLAGTLAIVREFYR
ncbi:hypothetical protein MGWOODY_Smn3068 [hydrothermal vent metagenome]|uniref:Uncharacterized protein n=1 Tax=hydrothermal vent metagenome TaxID=652676 RepID=A0A160TGL7_9ZZZZ